MSNARALQYREREKAIIEAAYKQLRTGTVPVISVTEIIRDTGLSTRAFYNLFESKEALVLALCRREFTKMTTLLAAAVATADSPAEAVRAWVSEALQAGYDDRRAPRTRIFHSVDARSAAGFIQLNKDGMDGQREILAAVIRQGRTEGLFPLADPDLDAQSIQAVVRSFVDARVAGDAGPSFEQARDHITGTYCRAFGAPPSSNPSIAGRDH